MREIIFRGKNPDNGKWYEGAYSPHNWDFFGMKSEIPQIIINSEDKYLDGKWIEVIPETVGQYTGLKDKNGKKVFEGDICDCYGDIGVIEFDEEDSMFIYTYAENVSTNFGCLYGTELEVIGNVFDNPELLKGE